MLSTLAELVRQTTGTAADLVFLDLARRGRITTAGQRITVSDRAAMERLLTTSHGGSHQRDTDSVNRGTDRPRPDRQAGANRRMPGGHQ
jgi:hypothetical protein